jgi:hypothetical protein
VQQDVSGVNRRLAARRTPATYRVQLASRSSAATAGSALVRVSRSSVLSVVGFLPEGATFSSAARLDSNNSASIYDWVPPKLGSVAGKVELPATEPSAPAGALEWNDDPAGLTVSDILDLAEAP